MTGLVRKATLVGVCALFAAGTALANVPDKANSTFPDWILVVGYTSAGNPDPGGYGTIPPTLACVTIRDFANNPIAGVRVDVDFSACCDINLCDKVLPNQTFKGCNPPVISGFTDAAGQFCFYATGAAKHTGGVVPGAGFDCVAIKLPDFPGFTAQRATAVAFDLDAATNNPGTGGVNSADLGSMGDDFLGTTYFGRSDYNCDGAINSADLGTQGDIFLNTAVGSDRNCNQVGANFCKTKEPGPNCSRTTNP